MYELIVLGLIPGTNLQITFELFVTVLLMMVGVMASLWYIRQYHAMSRLNLRIVMLGETVKKLVFNWKNTLPPKLQLFK